MSDYSIQPDSNLIFKCRYCQKVHDDIEILISVALNGAVFLLDSKIGFWGVNCLGCKKLSLIEEDLTKIKLIRAQISQKFIDNNPKYTGPPLKYFSFPHGLFDIGPKFNLPTDSITNDAFDSMDIDEIKLIYFEDGNIDLPTGASTYFFGDQSFGRLMRIWWFDKDNRLQALRIENQKEKKVFPRVRPHDPLLEQFVIFVNHYRLLEEYRIEIAPTPDVAQISSAKDLIEILTILPTHIQHGIWGYHNNILNSIEENPNHEKYSPYTQELKKYLDEFNNEEIQRREREQIHHIWELDLDFREIYLWDLVKKFMGEILVLACKSYFTPLDVFSIKRKYFEILYDGFFKGEKEEAGNFELSDQPPVQENPEFQIAPEEINITERGEDSIYKEKSNYDHLVKKVTEYELLDPALKRIVSTDPEILKIKCQIAQNKNVDSNFLILGETGTGKSLFAEIIHQVRRPEGEMKAINSANLNSHLFESELLGYKKGAFTDAQKDKMGDLEYYGDGTIFFDEIGDASPEIQTKLLRVIEDKKAWPIGGNEPYTVNAMFIFATNKDLNKEIEARNFREDLFYRLDRFTLKITPLRERLDDLPLVAEQFRSKFNQKYKKNIPSFSTEMLEKMRKYRWSGNVRELGSFVEKIIRDTEGNEITMSLLEKWLPGEIDDNIESDIEGDETRKSRRKIEDEELIYWMEKLENNKTHVAKKLKVKPITIRRRWKAIEEKMKD